MVGRAGCRRQRLPWRSRAGLAGAVDHVFKRGQLLHPHRATGMKAARGNSNFRAHAEFAPIGVLGGGVMQNNGAVDFGQERLGGGGSVWHCDAGELSGGVDVHTSIADATKQQQEKMIKVFFSCIFLYLLYLLFLGLPRPT